MGTLFISGVYGVGKSTLAEKLSLCTGIPYYSASDLISQVNGESYRIIKSVSDIHKNQCILANSVRNKLKTAKSLFLAGHFCVTTPKGNLFNLPESIFDLLSIDCIILLEATSTALMANLFKRDHKHYTQGFLASMMLQERLLAQATAERLSIPLITHQMTYLGNDHAVVLNALKQTGTYLHHN